jgi:hypothetical protein
MAGLVAFYGRSHIPDLHWFTAAWAWFAARGDDKTLFSISFALNAPPISRTPAECERSGASNLKERKLELRWHVAIGWHVAVDFETDADFNQNGCCPSHGVLL